MAPRELVSVDPVSQKHERILRALQKAPANRKCFNCDALGTSYVVPQFGIFVCTDCSGKHMGVGQRVKSVSMGRFTPEEIHTLEEEGGNENAAHRYLARWKGDQDLQKPVGKNPRAVETWVKAVFVDKRFYSEVHIQKEPATSLSADGTTAIPVRRLSDAMGHSGVKLEVSAPAIPTTRLVVGAPIATSSAAATPAPAPAPPTASLLDFDSPDAPAPAFSTPSQQPTASAGFDPWGSSRASSNGSAVLHQHQPQQQSFQASFPSGSTFAAGPGAAFQTSFHSGAFASGHSNSFASFPSAASSASSGFQIPLGKAEPFEPAFSPAPGSAPFSPGIPAAHAAPAHLQPTFTSSSTGAAPPLPPLSPPPPQQQHPYVTFSASFASSAAAPPPAAAAAKLSNVPVPPAVTNSTGGSWNAAAGPPAAARIPSASSEWSDFTDATPAVVVPLGLVPSVAAPIAPVTSAATPAHMGAAQKPLSPAGQAAARNRSELPSDLFSDFAPQQGHKGPQATAHSVPSLGFAGASAVKGPVPGGFGGAPLPSALGSSSTGLPPAPASSNSYSMHSTFPAQAVRPFGTPSSSQSGFVPLQAAAGGPFGAPVNPVFNTSVVNTVPVQPANTYGAPQHQHQQPAFNQHFGAPPPAGDFAFDAFAGDMRKALPNGGAAGWVPTPATALAAAPSNGNPFA